MAYITIGLLFNNYEVKAKFDSILYLFNMATGQRGRRPKFQGNCPTRPEAEVSRQLSNEAGGRSFKEYL
jgi:hypothetical protein